MSAGSSTCVIELPSRTTAAPSAGDGAGVLGKRLEPQLSFERRLGDSPSATRPSFEQMEAGNFEASGGRVVKVAEKWNSPRINTWRLGAVFWSMMIMGANDAAYGVSISHPSNRRRVREC